MPKPVRSPTSEAIRLTTSATLSDRVKIRRDEVAEKNGVKESAYGTAYDSMVSLQHDLTNMAREGNDADQEIQDSKEPVEAKVPQIVAALHQYRALANMVAAKYSGNVFDAMQRILDAEGTGQSARQFAQAHGVDVGNMFRQPEDQQEPRRSGKTRPQQPRIDMTHREPGQGAGLPPQQAPPAPDSPMP